MAMMPSPAPTKPPATLAAPTVTLPLACESMMKAVLKYACPSPKQPVQLKLLSELDATSPPAMLPSPACTLPMAAGRHDRAGIVADQAAGLQVRDVRTADVADRAQNSEIRP